MELRTSFDSMPWAWRATMPLPTTMAIASFRRRLKRKKAKDCRKIIKASRNITEHQKKTKESAVKDRRPQTSFRSTKSLSDFRRELSCLHSLHINLAGRHSACAAVRRSWLLPEHQPLGHSHGLYCVYLTLGVWCASSSIAWLPE